MEMNQIICDNLGMTRDNSISSLSKDRDGATNYAFENHNIRVMAINDNTKFAVTNEKSTKYETELKGIFIGGCTCGRYLVVFMQDQELKRQLTHNPNSISIKPDFIYRIEYTNKQILIDKLYQGNLNFSVNNPIEAIGYYESTEVQKVYWVDGLNQNRFINITKFDNSPYEKKYFYYVWLDFIDGDVTNKIYEAFYYKEAKDKLLVDGKLYALCKKDGTVMCYASELSSGANVWLPSEVDGVISISDLPVATHSIDLVTYQYNDYSFDFQGHIMCIPNVLKLEKNYSKSGIFQAGVIQYFFTYYNKYGVETCLVWNSDLQYISLSDRGGKADESVSLAFDFEVTNFDESYDYLRIYVAYRSGLNGVVSARILADINLENVSQSTVIKFTDYGNNGINFNSEDIPYIGGQDIRANTLDYKQDTLFLGDIIISDFINYIDFPKHELNITNIGGFEENEVKIQEGGIDVYHQFITWAYKYVSSIITSGVYDYIPEIKNSQKSVAGFKWREIYRFGIQFMSYEGTWTPAYWIGDKYCDLPPRTFTERDMYITIREEGGDSGVIIHTYPITETDQFGNFVRTEYYDLNDERIYEEELETYAGTYTKKEVHFKYEGEGCYMATAMLDINAVIQSIAGQVDLSKYTSYRLLMADMDISSRRIVEQGVINPTMFNYVDRYYNRPFSIPSWIFRPRISAITNRHYDTLPIQNADNAELQGIIKKQVPGFEPKHGNNMNSYMFIVAVNDASIWSGFIQWKLIYYNSGNTKQEQAERLYLTMYKGSHAFPLETPDDEKEKEYGRVADLIVKYKLYMKLATTDDPGKDIVGPFENIEDIDIIKSYLRNNYVPVHIYRQVDNLGGGYKQISAHIYDNDNKTGTTTPSMWSTLRSKLVEFMSEDMRNTTEEQVGKELAGKIVLDPAMLPNEDLLKDIATSASEAEEIILAVMAALVAAAAVVISALSCGTMTGPMAFITATAIEAAISVCAAGAVGLAAGACLKSIDTSRMNDVCKKMLAMGYYPVGGQSTRLSARQQRSKNIGLLLESFFPPYDYVSQAENNQHYNTGIYKWRVPVLDDDARESTGKVNWKDDIGRVPFTTGHPYTLKGRIGEDYNAFIITGQLTSLEEDETDMRHKQNLFCIDESIVTLNSPDLENIVTIVDGAKSLRLDLVGMIPIDTTYGIYNMAVEGSLNSNSQVIQGRYHINKLNDSPLTATGMLCDSIYQDFKCEESAIGGDPIQVTENIGTYRVFMWNKKIAGFWFPNITLLSPINKEVLTKPGGEIQNKIFANMRYSASSSFHNPVRFNIEPPAVCLDDDTTLKSFHYHSDIKNYYKNVDTISVNNSAYPLVENGLNFPQDEEKINIAGLKDPVHIKYKTTSHILLSFPWDEIHNASQILPYTSKEGLLEPLNLYNHEDLGNIKLNGVCNDAPPIRESYTLIKYIDESVEDSWSYPNSDDYTVYASLNEIDSDTGDTYLQKLKNMSISEKAETKTPFDDTTNLFYLLQAGNKHFYTIFKRDDIWYSIQTKYITENSIIVIDDKTLYATKYANESTGEINLESQYTLNEILTENPIVGTWMQSSLYWRYRGEQPYLFMGELVKKVFDYNTWMGGYSPYALQQLIWNVASKVTPINELVNESWGDTYYQRWDCEKIYPYTEEDVNSNVEILSFMLESHTNLDGRCDVNRGIHNLLNVRPYNTIFNNIYTQKDNFFTYQVLDDKFSKSHFEADIVWSLTKNNMDNIDKWTCLLSSNEMSLDGRYGTVRKVLNVNDVLIAFQDTGISNIRYNETVALNTTTGLPVQMGNTGKVDGYRMISDTIGCHNKFSISKNSAGVFFADDVNKSFNHFTTNGGISNISMRANFSSWFKNNLNGHLWKADTRDNFRVSYDEITNDLYIIRNDICVIYNTLLQKFTSFMDYIDTPIITRLISQGGDSDTFAIRSTVNKAHQSVIEIWRMLFGASTDLIYGAQGAYGYIYGKFCPYSMEYRLNPDPFHDSIFTNYQYAADWIDPLKEVDDGNLFNSAVRRYTTFDTVEAKNEYQHGIMSIQQSGNIAGSTIGLRRVFGRQSVKSMFRLWRGEIPRNGDTLTGHTPLSDRMRNPWIHLKFEKKVVDDSKMIFHNLMINYYNQYGRF